uniref:leucine-rich repeat domain-containing protein n=1 Tax=Capnocytophaga leadbetteri TaxID=327575 RepID=UPI0028D0FD73|nr:leucine-rich repeat domain-containing protein [Capnocytophaga leadbetteri]
MKKILTFLCAAALVACGKDDKGGENPTPTPPHYDNLSVATNTVSFTTLSSTQSVGITAGSGSYTATTALPIVSLEVVSNTLQLTSVATGTTTVTVVDTKSQQKAEITVSVKALYSVESETITHSDRHNFADDTHLVLTDVKAVGDNVFKGFGEFISITTKGVETFGNNAFHSCQQVEYINLEGVKSIGTGAFQSNASVKTVTITGVEGSPLKIGKEAFANCAELKSVSLPAQTTEIGASAFNFCRQLASLRIAATEPPKVFRTTFPSKVAGTNRVLYVPKGSKAKYEAVAFWKDKFSSIEETDF